MVSAGDRLGVKVCPSALRAFNNSSRIDTVLHPLGGIINRLFNLSDQFRFRAIATIRPIAVTPQMAFPARH